MLTQYERNRLENIQKKCLKCIYGYNKKYEELLNESGIQTLEDRRMKAIEKFARKTSQNKQFEHWFKKNENRSSQRIGKEYEELYARSDRLYNSPMYEMRRILNGTDKSERNTISNYCELSNLFNQP